jgi:hypothetical protein
MNRNEMQRITVLPLPNSLEKDQKKVNYGIISCVEIMAKRDEDKERRLRKLEENHDRSTTVKRDIYLVNGDYSIKNFNNDAIVVCDAPGAINVYFPVASGTNKTIIVKNFGVAAVTVIASGTDTIDENPSQLVLANEGIVFYDYSPGSWLVT